MSRHFTRLIECFPGNIKSASHLWPALSGRRAAARALHSQRQHFRVPRQLDALAIVKVYAIQIASDKVDLFDWLFPKIDLHVCALGQRLRIAYSHLASVMTVALWPVVWIKVDALGIVLALKVPCTVCAALCESIQWRAAAWTLVSVDAVMARLESVERARAERHAMGTGIVCVDQETIAMALSAKAWMRDRIAAGTRDRVDEASATALRVATSKKSDALDSQLARDVEGKKAQIQPFCNQ